MNKTKAIDGSGQMKATMNEQFLSPIALTAIGRW